MTERVARREIERNGDRWKLADMVDREWSRARGELRDGRERDLRAARRSDVDVLQRVRTAAELGLHLEYHAILRRLGVDRRDQALPESVVERGVDSRGRDAQAPDDVGGVDLADRERLQVDQHAAAVQRDVAAVDADERRQALDGRVA